MKYGRFVTCLIFIAVTLVLSGCAAKQAYEGEKLPAEQVALIKGSTNPFGTSASITSIDGEEGMRWTSGEVEALPGYHELEVVLQTGVYMIYSFAKVKIAFTAEANHVYRVEGKIRQGKVMGVWIVDENDDSIVAGKKP